MKSTVCFSHGQESGPWGTKIRAMADAAEAAGWPVESLDYQGIADPSARVEMLVDWMGKQKQPPVLVGSSMGGFVAYRAATLRPVAGLLLLAPAIYLPGYEELLPAASPSCPITVVHGWRDDVIPWEHSLRFAREQKTKFVLVDGDHRLTAQLDDIVSCLALMLDQLEHDVP